MDEHAKVNKARIDNIGSIVNRGQRNIYGGYGQCEVSIEKGQLIFDLRNGTEMLVFPHELERLMKKIKVQKRRERISKLIQKLLEL